MKQAAKIVFLTAGIGFLLFHFIMISCYSFSLGKYSNVYTYPFFHQNWSLFSPPADCNYNLYASYGNKQSTDILNEIVVSHQTNRFAGKEALVIAFTNSIHYFEKDALANGFSEGNAESNEKFEMIKKMARGYLRHVKKVDPAKLKLILVVSPANSNQKRVYYN